MFIVIDFEATCSNTNVFPRDEMEIIEIGAVLCQSKHDINLSSFQSFIRPIRHPVLTEFCTELTTIQQEHVDSAPLFPKMMELFLAWRKKHGAEIATFCSWGNFDDRILRENCEFHGVDYPFPEHCNVKKLFAQKQNCKPKGMSGALRKMQIPLEGTHHRGIDDARNIAKLLVHCF